jgi:hypothetical protein
MGNTTDTELTVKVRAPRTKSQRLEYCQLWQKKLESQYRELKDKRTQALKYLEADPSIVTTVEDRSEVTTTDMQDAIDTVKPDMLEAIAGVDEPLKLDPDSAKDVEPAKKLQAWGNRIIKRKNPWWRLCNDFLDDSMVLQFGCIKYRWVEEKVITRKTFEGWTDIEKQQMTGDSGWEVESDAPEDKDKKRSTVIAKTEIDEYVAFEGVPSERVRFPLDTKSFARCPMVIEEVRLHEHEYRELYGDGAFEKVKDIHEAWDSHKRDSSFEERFKHVASVGGIQHVYDSLSGKYKAYECYFWEGKTAWMHTWVADITLKDEENKYGRPPYEGASPFLVAHSLIGKGYYDRMKQLIEERTILKRQMTDIITQNAYRRMFIDVESSGMNIDDYENNSATNALVRFGAPPSEFVMPEPKPPLTGDYLQMWEVLAREKDEHLPTPRAYSGIEGAREKETYRGRQLKVAQASKKVSSMMRSYMEEAFIPLFQDMLDCFAKFAKQPSSFRYLGQDYELNPLDIVCKFSLIVNIGLGSHDKQDLVVKLQQLIGLADRHVQLGFITPQNMYYMYSELVRAMGFLNTMDFVTDPAINQVVMKFVQMVMAVVEHFGQVSPEISQAFAPIARAAQQVMSALGQMPEGGGKGGENTKGTQPGETPAAIPKQRANPMEEQTQISGGGFFA